MVPADIGDVAVLEDNDGRQAIRRIVGVANGWVTTIGFQYFEGAWHSFEDQRREDSIKSRALVAAAFARAPTPDDIQPNLLARGEGLDRLRMSFGSAGFVAISELEIDRTDGIKPNFGPIAFREDWLNDLGVSSGDARLVTVQDDSMEPTLIAGDVVLIDTTRINVSTGLVYAFSDSDGQFRLKRFEQPSNDVVILRSDNPSNPLEFRQGKDLGRLVLHGEVVWSGHSWR